MGKTLSSVSVGDNFILNGTEFELIQHETSFGDLSLCKFCNHSTQIYISKSTWVGEPKGISDESPNPHENIIENAMERNNMLYTINTYKRWNRTSCIVGILLIIQALLFYYSDRSNFTFSMLIVTFVGLLITVFFGAWFGKRYNFVGDGRID